MSNATQGLRRKILSADQLQSVVRTMKALAAANISQYENSVRALADYSRTVALGLGACFRLEEAPPPARYAVGEVGAIVFGSDQGLVGQFNEVIANHAATRFAQRGAKLTVWTVGERVQATLSRGGWALQGAFVVPTSVQGIAPLVAQLLAAIGARFSDRTDYELYLFYNRSGAGEGYEPAALRLLPLDERWKRELAAQPWPSTLVPEVLCSDAVTLRALVREYLFISLFKAGAESLTSENRTRLAAMERADRNIEGLLETFKQQFHQLRQSDIDEELFDVVAGAEQMRPARAQ